MKSQNKLFFKKMLGNPMTIDLNKIIKEKDKINKDEQRIEGRMEIVDLMIENPDFKFSSPLKDKLIIIVECGDLHCGIYPDEFEDGYRAEKIIEEFRKVVELEKKIK